MTGAWKFSRGCLEPTLGIQLSDRGFRYGMGVFETIRIRLGRAEFLPAHLELFERACLETGLPLEQVGSLRQSAIEHLAATLPDGSLRLILTAGDGGPRDPVLEPREFLFFEACAPLPQERYQRGYAVAEPVLCDRTIHRHIKTLNYWANIDVLWDARQRGYDEVVITAWNGRVKGAAMANLFLCLGDRWVTPLEEDGARPGVLRARVLPLLDAAEESVDLGMFKAATAAFLTSSGLGVMPVRAFGSHELPDFENTVALWRSFGGLDFR